MFRTIGIGFLEDLSGLNITIHLAEFLAVASGIFVLGVMKETKDKYFQIVFSKQNYSQGNNHNFRTALHHKFIVMQCIRTTYFI